MIHLKLILTFLILLLTSFGYSFAHTGAMGVVKERMELMKDMGKKMKEMKRMVKGKQIYETNILINHARSVQKSTKKIIGLFPKGSLEKPTEAKPLIQEKMDDFKSIVKRMSDETEQLENTVILNAKKSIISQLKKVGKFALVAIKNIG